MKEESERGYCSRLVKEAYGKEVREGVKRGIEEGVLGRNVI